MPTGVTGAYNNSQQTDRVTITSPGGNYTAAGQVTITINGISETYTAALGEDQSDAVADLVPKINAIAGISVSASDGAAGTIDIQADVAGVGFTLSTNTNEGTITSTNTVGSGQFIITGTPNITVDATTTFNYTITTSGNPNGCGEDSITGTIIVEPAPEITRVSTLALANQTLVVNHLYQLLILFMIYQEVLQEQLMQDYLQVLLQIRQPLQKRMKSQ